MVLTATKLERDMLSLKMNFIFGIGKFILDNRMAMVKALHCHRQPSSTIPQNRKPQKKTTEKSHTHKHTNINPQPTKNHTQFNQSNDISCLCVAL